MMPYLDALNQLCQPIRVGEYPHTLDPMRMLMAALGNPHQDLQAVVVAGSTGKGTTCSHLAQVLRASGLNVGLYTSPHLHSFRERFVYNDALISQEAFVEAYAVVQAAAADLNHHYSTFEQATALALWWFAHQKPDMVVLEIGLGGRFDAVNVVMNLLAVLTPIEIEHIAILGGSQQAIAWHKAGVIQQNGHAMTVEQPVEVWSVLEAEAHQRGATLQIIHDANHLAFAAYENLAGRGLAPTSAFEGGQHFRSLPGRLEQVTLPGHTLLIDGGHTPRSAAYLRAEIGRLAPPDQPVWIVIGMLGDKSVQDYLRYFDSPRFHIVFTQAPGHRATTPQVLHQQSSLHFASAEMIPDRAAAFTSFTTAPEALVVVAGSLRMAAAAREYFGLLSHAELAEAEATRAIFSGANYLSRLNPPTARTE